MCCLIDDEHYAPVVGEFCFAEIKHIVDHREHDNGSEYADTEPDVDRDASSDDVNRGMSRKASEFVFLPRDYIGLQ